MLRQSDPLADRKLRRLDAQSMVWAPPSSKCCQSSQPRQGNECGRPQACACRHDLATKAVLQIKYGVRGSFWTTCSDRLQWEETCTEASARAGWNLPHACRQVFQDKHDAKRRTTEHIFVTVTTVIFQTLFSSIPYVMTTDAISKHRFLTNDLKNKEIDIPVLSSLSQTRLCFANWTFRIFFFNLGGP